MSVKEWTVEKDGSGYLINGMIRIPLYEGHEEDLRAIAAIPKLIGALRQYHEANRIHNDEEWELFVAGREALRALAGDKETNDT